MKRFLPLYCLFFFLLACTDDREPEAVESDEPGSFYQDFRVWGEEGREEVTVRLQFLEGGRDGDAVQLGGSGTVFLDATPLPVDSSKFNGVYYEISLPVEAFRGKHFIRFVGADQKEYREEFSFEPFSLAEELPEEMKKAPFEIQLENFRDESSFVRLVMVDTSMQSDDVNEEVLVEGGVIAITEAHLANLTEGPIYLEIYREEERPVKNKAGGGGKLAITYALKRQFSFIP